MTPDSRMLLALSQTYALNITNLELLYDGINKIFACNANETELILKLSPTDIRNPRQIAYERRLTKHVHTNGIECAKPLFPNNGKKEKIYIYSGRQYYGTLTHKIKGTPFTPEISHSQLYAFGLSLSKLHKCVQPHLATPPPSLINATQIVKKLSSPIDSVHMGRLRKIIKKLFDDIQSHPIALDPNNASCICHGDAWPGNALYIKNSCVLLDFEHSRICQPAFDISTFLWWMLGQHDDKSRITAWDRFQEGYGDALAIRLDNNTATYIKINELRSLVFLYDHVHINDEIFEHINQQTRWLLKELSRPLMGCELLALLHLR